MAILSEVGIQDERVLWYSAYGIPFGMPAGDTDCDGDVDFADLLTIQDWISGSTYDVRGDLNLDGVVDAADGSLAVGMSGTALGWEVLSAIDSRKGYAGYEHAPELAGTSYHVRYRVLKADLGRWLTRDPLGYVDGMSLYAYVQGRATVAVDSRGLDSAAGDDPKTPPIKRTPIEDLKDEDDSIDKELEQKPDPQREQDLRRRKREIQRELWRRLLWERYRNIFHHDHTMRAQACMDMCDDMLGPFKNGPAMKACYDSCVEKGIPDAWAGFCSPVPSDGMIRPGDVKDISECAESWLGDKVKDKLKDKVKDYLKDQLKGWLEDELTPPAACPEEPAEGRP